MSQLVAVITAFPTVIFSVLMVVVLLYWGMVILGALDVDLFGGAEGHGEGALEGAGEGAEGALEGSGEGAGEGAAEGHGHGDVDADGGDGEHHGSGGILEAIGLRKAPITVTLSLIIFYCWAVCIIGSQLLAGVSLSPLLQNTALLVGAVVLSLVATNLTSRPLGRVFEVHQAPARKTLVGQVCTVSTGRVSESFGQATVEDGGAGLLVPVRCDRPEALRRGQQALIIAYDDEREAYLVEPYDELMR